VGFGAARGGAFACARSRPQARLPELRGPARRRAWRAVFVLPTNRRQRSVRLERDAHRPRLEASARTDAHEHGGRTRTSRGRRSPRVWGSSLRSSRSPGPPAISRGCVPS
jgi:hypothetical protein